MLSENRTKRQMAWEECSLRGSCSSSSRLLLHNNYLVRLHSFRLIIISIFSLTCPLVCSRVFWPLFRSRFELSKSTCMTLPRLARVDFVTFFHLFCSSSSLSLCFIHCRRRRRRLSKLSLFLLLRTKANQLQVFEKLRIRAASGCFRESFIPLKSLKEFPLFLEQGFLLSFALF